MKRQLLHLFDVLDWCALGEIYCDHGGDRFWAETRDDVVDKGLAWADALLSRVNATGHSLYVGAGVAELPAMLAEIEAGRQVAAANLRERECRVLNDGLRRLGYGDRLSLVPGDARAVATPAAFDHVAAVSVLSDPESYPTLSAVTYGRVPPPALDVAAFVAERERARDLARTLFGALRLPGWITTTADEVAWFIECAEAAGVGVDADDLLLDTAVVGDPIGFLRVLPPATGS